MSKNRIKSFQKDRLDQAIAARRLSQAQLASMVGISAATISKWRSGTCAPEPNALKRLADVINIAPEWFTRPMAKKISPPLFRSNASAHKNARNMLEARAEWAQDIAISLMEFVDYPEVNLPSCSYSYPEAITHEDIEQVAQECRDLWGLGRSVIQDIALAVESAGIILIREETDTPKIEGLSAWSESLGARPFIFLSADKDNGYRSRFDIAHELGHLILHKFIKNPNETSRHKLLEKQAHYFAGAFLLPAESFALDVLLPPTLDELLPLKERWGVSVAAIIMRLLALKLIDEDTARYLFKRRSARWGAKSEPLDGTRKPEHPRLLRRTIDLLAHENIMPLENIARHIGLSSHDVESLAGLPEGYLERGNNIVPFPQLRKSSISGSDQTSKNSKSLKYEHPSRYSKQKSSWGRSVRISAVGVRDRNSPTIRRSSKKTRNA